MSITIFPKSRVIPSSVWFCPLNKIKPYIIKFNQIKLMTAVEFYTRSCNIGGICCIFPPGIPTHLWLPWYTGPQSSWQAPPSRCQTWAECRGRKTTKRNDEDDNDDRTTCFMNKPLLIGSAFVQQSSLPTFRALPPFSGSRFNYKLAYSVGKINFYFYLCGR